MSFYLFIEQVVEACGPAAASSRPEEPVLASWRARLAAGALLRGMKGRLPSPPALVGLNPRRDDSQGSLDAGLPVRPRALSGTLDSSRRELALLQVTNLFFRKRP